MSKFKESMSKKCVSGVVNAVGASAVYNHKKIAVPDVSSGDREDKVKTSDRASDQIQKTKAPRVVAKSKESANSIFDYSSQMACLQEARDDNQRSKEAQKLAEKKERAKSAARASLEVKQREHVEVAARALSFLDAQPALMDEIVEEAKRSLREYYTKQMREEVYAEYAKTATAHKEEAKAELIRQLTPEIVASLKAQYKAHYVAQAKDWVTKLERGMERTLVDSVKNAPQSATKRSFKQAFDEVNDGGSSPKRRGTLEEEVVESRQGVKEERTWRSEAVTPEIATPQPSSPARRGVKRKFEREHDEDDYSDGSPKRVRISEQGSEDGESDAKTEENRRGGVDTRESSKENLKPETEAIVPKVAPPGNRRVPFLEVSESRTKKRGSGGRTSLK